MPSALAAAIFAAPAGASSPLASSRAMRSLFGRDQPLFALRGVTSSIVRSSSRRRPRLSTQPKQSASSTASS